jgi:hypothetical protein
MLMDVSDKLLFINDCAVSFMKHCVMPRGLIYAEQVFYVYVEKSRVHYDDDNDCSYNRVEQYLLNLITV